MRSPKRTLSKRQIAETNIIEKTDRRNEHYRKDRSPKRTLSKRQIAEMHTVEIHIIEIEMVEIKIAEDILRRYMNNPLYDNHVFFFVPELYTAKRQVQLESFGNCNDTFDR
jgi:hypothetical protein